MRDRQSCQAERINRRRKREEEGGEYIRGQPPSYTASHGVRSKKYIYRREKDKNPETRIYRLI